MKALRTAFFSLSLCAAPALTQAGILGNMTQMFLSNSTASGVYTTKDRVSAFGGSFEMRAPITAINLVAFDPPRFDAGCGGVDLYGGSFSFINSQQLVQIFRQVAANAVGLAFKAAVNAIAPNLGNLMSEFQTMMQHLNGLAKNSCQLAGLLVDKGEQSLSSAVGGQGSLGSIGNGVFSDSIDALSNYVKDADGYLTKVGQTNPKAGNATYKAVLNSGASAMLGLAGISNFDGSVDDATNPNSLNNRILVSLLGSEVSGLPCTNQSADGTPDTQSQPPNTTLSTVTCHQPATITLQDIVDGGGTGSLRPNTPLKIYSCANPSGNGVKGAGVDSQPCTSVELDNLDYPGIRGYVNTALFGNADPSLPPTNTSIVGSIGGSVILTPQQLELLHQAGLPLMALMAHARSPEMREAIAQKLSEHMITCIASSVGESLYKAANLIRLGGDNNLSDEVKARVDALRTDYLAERESCLEDRRVLEVIQEMNESLKLVSNHDR